MPFGPCRKASTCGNFFGILAAFSGSQKPVQDHNLVDFLGSVRCRSVCPSFFRRLDRL